RKNLRPRRYRCRVDHARPPGWGTAVPCKSFPTARSAHPIAMSRPALVRIVVTFQTVFCLAHLFLYETWTFSSASAAGVDAVASPALWLKLAVALLSISFVSASLLAWRYKSSAVRAYYSAAAVWLGLFSFLFIASVLAWVIFAAARFAGLALDFHCLVQI